MNDEKKDDIPRVPIEEIPTEVLVSVLKKWSDFRKHVEGMTTKDGEKTFCTMCMWHVCDLCRYLSIKCHGLSGSPYETIFEFTNDDCKICPLPPLGWCTRTGATSKLHPLYYVREIGSWDAYLSGIDYFIAFISEVIKKQKENAQ